MHCQQRPALPGGYVNEPSRMVVAAPLASYGAGVLGACQGALDSRLWIGLHLISTDYTEASSSAPQGMDCDAVCEGRW
jgi:hypothetical protein